MRKGERRRVSAEKKADDKEMPLTKNRNGEESEQRRGNGVRHCLNEEGRKEARACVRKRNRMIKKCLRQGSKAGGTSAGNMGRKVRNREGLSLE